MDAEVINKLADVLLPLGKVEYQVPAEEISRLQSWLSNELRKPIGFFTVKNGIKRIKKDMEIPTVHGKSHLILVNGKLERRKKENTREPKTRARRGSNLRIPIIDDSEMVAIATKLVKKVYKKAQSKLHPGVLSLRNELNDTKKKLEEMTEKFKEANEDALLATKKLNDLRLDYDRVIQKLRIFERIQEEALKISESEKVTGRRRTDAII